MGSGISTKYENTYGNKYSIKTVSGRNLVVDDTDVQDYPVKLPDNQSQLRHYFANRAGHAPCNQNQLLELLNNENTYIGTDKWGNKWHAENLPDGTQPWANQRNGIMNEGGVNKSEWVWDDVT